MTEKMSTIAWQGITLRVPTDWSLVGVSGDEKKGYFRADGPIAAALEVRWSRAFGHVPDLMTKAREFLVALEKSCKKDRVKFSSKLKAEGGSERSVGFSWKSDRQGQGRLTYCAQCDRVVIAQVVSSPDENVSRVAPTILASLSDHRDDGRANWALYGLEFVMPAGYKIEKQSLMSGYLSLAFKDGAKTVVVERWGLANTLMAGDTLEQWFRKDVVPDIKGYRIRFDQCRIAGHEALKISGLRGGIKQAAKAFAKSLTLHPHPGCITGYAWQCEESNRIFGVRATHLPDEQIAEQIRDSIECHSDTTE